MENTEQKWKDLPMFDDKTFSSLLKDIYDNSTRKRKQIDILINELRPLITKVADAALVVPLIKEYMEVGVKNDDQLTKMASVYQKFIAAENRPNETGGQGNSILPDHEKEQLLKDIKDESAQLVEKKVEVSHNLDDLIKKVDELKLSVKEEEVNGEVNIVVEPEVSQVEQENGAGK